VGRFLFFFTHTFIASFSCFHDDKRNNGQRLTKSSPTKAGATPHFISLFDKDIAACQMQGMQNGCITLLP